MKVIDPVNVTAAMLISSSLPETDHPMWDAGATYAMGARVLRPTASAGNVRIFESVAGGNIGNDPAAPGTTAWIDVAPANRWAMLDRAVGTTAIGTGVISMELEPGAVSSLAVLDTNADEVRVVLSVSGTVLLDETRSALAGGEMIADWYSYFTAILGRVSVLLFDDLPIYSNCRIAVTITGPDPVGPVTVGTLLTGRMIELGKTEAGVAIGINDFSRKDTDEFGVTTVVERGWSKRMVVRSLIATDHVDHIQRKLATMRGRPALYLGEAGYDSLAVYGFYKDFSIDLALSTISYCSMTVDGLI